MQHIEEQVLAAIALGEDGREDCGPHLAHCRVCAAELDAFMRVVAGARAGSPADIPRRPPERVWSVVKRTMGRAGRPESD
ncbi:MULTISPECIES: hypothetical protein [Streptomyces]|uniref:hypothetical protein n=1 Tax=Streptomyces sp. SYP-A7185 TaxID=3040076 RepID=UPI0038F67771